ncbi:MAG: lactate utilization protein [Bacteroidia bacterium]
MHEQQITARERVLKKVRKALIQKDAESTLPPPQTDLDKDVFVKQGEDLAIVFAQEFITNNGHFEFCEDEEAFLFHFKQIIQKSWKNIVCYEPELGGLLKQGGIPFSDINPDMATLEVGVTGCDALVARTGSVIVTARKNHSRMISVFPGVHVVVAYMHQLDYDLKDSFARLKKIYEGALPSMTSIISGPSRTADIEKTLVLGAHGPKELYVFLIDEQ